MADLTRRLTALALALVALSTGCQRHVFADSLGAQVVANGSTTGDGHVWHATPGATLEDHADDVIAAARLNPPTIRLALGSNEVLEGGWDDWDRAVWSWVLMSIPARTCVTVVLPHFTASAVLHFPEYDPAQMEAARAWLSTVDRVDRVVDWRPVVEGMALWLPDGIHLGDATGIEARHDTTLEGCP